MKDVQHSISTKLTADVFKAINTGNSAKNIIKKNKSMPDRLLNMAGRHVGINEEHLPIYRKLVRGENNEFLEKLKGFNHQLQPGDLILVTGIGTSSKTLVKLQKSFYEKARSSHIAVAHSEFVCVDAIPKTGVSLRLVPEILRNVENNWRVIRLKNIPESSFENISKSCIYYTEQPYLIFLKRKPAKNYSYCSELARKIYISSDIKECGIPNKPIIKPCDFDNLADRNSEWEDITESVRSYIEFCVEYEGFLMFMSKLLLNGINLNRQRFDERIEIKRKISRMVKKGEITSQTASKVNENIKTREDSLNYKFWNK